MTFAKSPGRAAALVCLTAELIPLVVVPALPGCGCSAIGCASGADVSVAIADDVDLRGATVTACFNDACVVSDPLPVFISLVEGTGLTFRGDPGPDGARVSGGVWPPGMGGDRLRVNWWFRNDTALRAGDRYRVSIDSYGNLVADKEETAVAYDKFEICDGACYTARFQ
jgi:hypothetical protein